MSCDCGLGSYVAPDTTPIFRVGDDGSTPMGDGVSLPPPID